MKALVLARAALAVLLVASAVLWVGALAFSSRPSAPALLVYGEPVALRGSTWPARVVAVWPNERRTAPFEGALVVEERRAALDDGVARVTLPSDGHEVTVAVEGRADGARARVAVEVQLSRLLPVGRQPRYEPWTREVARGGAGANSGPPVYPVAGRVPALLPTSLLVLHEGAVELVERQPNAAGAVLSDGRVLRTDPSGVVVHVPAAVRPGAELEAELAYAFALERVYVELIVNGLVRDMRVLEGSPASVRLDLPDDARAGWFAVRASPSPLPAIPAHHAVGVLLDEGDPGDPAVVVAHLARHPAFRDGSDPLLRQLVRAPPTSMAPVRALLGRLRVDDARAPNLAPPAREQAARDDAERARAVARFRVPFRITGGLFALLAAVLALASVRAGRRWHDEVDDGGAARRGRTLPSLGWALLAFMVSVSALWVLDWAIGLMLGQPSA